MGRGQDRTYSGPGTYQLVYSIFGNSDTNVGTDSEIRIRHLEHFVQTPIPDAWRFDDAGCQTGARLVLSNDGLTKACPAYKGTNQLTVTQYGLDLDGSAFLRLAIQYDSFTPVASTRYTVWVITFDHSLSNIGPAPPDRSTCGGVDECENMFFDYAGVLVLPATMYMVPNCDQDRIVFRPGIVATWNGGCQYPDPTLSRTWGRVKSLYR